MDNTIYNNYKNDLIEFSENTFKYDKPARRQSINDYLDSLLRDLSHCALVELISEKQYNLYAQWLVNLCCKLH